MPSPAKKSAPTSTKSAAKPIESTSVAKSVAPTKAAVAKPVVAKPTLSSAERMKMIAEAAYYLAQKRGFSGGNELSDWVAAEKQVDTLLSKRG